MKIIDPKVLIANTSHDDYDIEGIKVLDLTKWLLKWLDSKKGVVGQAVKYCVVIMLLSRGLSYGSPLFNAHHIFTWHVSSNTLI